MVRKTVVLSADERAICRVRYRHVKTYLDPGPQPMTPNDKVVQAIAGHWKNGEKLEAGEEYSDLLFPFGNKRAVSRHVNKGSPKTVDADREIARAWVETQPKHLQAEIFSLLGLHNTLKMKKDDPVKKEDAVKDEAVEVESSLAGKRKHEDVDESEEASKASVLSKRPKHETSSEIKEEEAAYTDARVKSEA